MNTTPADPIREALAELKRYLEWTQREGTGGERASAHTALKLLEAAERALAQQPKPSTDGSVRVALAEFHAKWSALPDYMRADHSFADMRDAANRLVRAALAQQPQAKPGEGAQLSRRLKTLADTYACFHAGGESINTDHPTRGELFALIDHVCIGLDSPQHPQAAAGEQARYCAKLARACPDGCKPEPGEMGDCCWRVKPPPTYTERAARALPAPPVQPVKSAALHRFRQWQREQGEDYPDGQLLPDDDEAAIEALLNMLPEFNG